MNSNTWLELLRHYVRWLCTESHRDVPLDVQWSGQAFRPLRYWTSCSSPLHMGDERICSSSLTVLAFHPKTPLVFVVFFNPHNFWDQKCAPPPPAAVPSGHNYWGVSSSLSNTVMYIFLSFPCCGTEGSPIHNFLFRDGWDESAVSRQAKGRCDGRCCWSYRCGWCCRCLAGWWV